MNSMNDSLHDPDREGSGEVQSALGEAAKLGRLAVPIALAQVGMILLHVVDTAILGRESPGALEAGALGRNIMFACMSLGLGVSLTLESIASQAVAAGERDRAWRSFTRVMRANMLIWPLMALAAIGIVLALPLIPGFHISAEAASGARGFIFGNLPVLFAQSGFVAARTLLQAYGRTLPSLFASIGANLLNWVVCNVLVRGDAFLASWHLRPIGLKALGPLGAGIAGSVSASFMCIWVLVAVQKHRAAGPNEAPTVPAILRMGSSVAVQLLAEIGAFALAGVVSVHFGQTQCDAFQIALQLASLTFMGALGVSGATSVRVGRAIGKGLPARRPGVVGMVMGASVMSLGALLFTAIPGELVARFTSDPTVLAAGVAFLHVAALFQLFDGVQVVSAGALRGAGDVRFASYCTIFAHWCVGIPFALFFGFGLHMGAFGLWCGLTLGLIAAATTMSSRFFWISRKLIERV